MAKKRRKRTSWAQGAWASTRKWLLIGGAICLVLVALLLWSERQHFIHPRFDINRSAYPVLGIDVSSHNGKINFSKVKADGVTFVYIKASEGTKFRDPKFASNHRAAAKAGLKTGAYHFFRKKADGKEQADNLLAATRGKKLDLPLVVDVEDWSNDRGIDDAAANRQLRDMLGELERHGVRPMIYTNGDGYKKYFSKQSTRHGYLWLCSFTSPSKLKGYNHQIQQFSHWGTVDGIDGNVDMNVFNGSASQWEAWLEEVKDNE